MSEAARARRRSRRRDRLDDDGHAGGHAGADEERDVAVILATGGMGLVRAAYSAGKPAYGVARATRPVTSNGLPTCRRPRRDIMMGKCFDNGVLCSSPNSVVVDEAIAEETRRQFQAHGALLPEAGRSRRAREGPGLAAAPAESGAGRQAGEASPKGRLSVPPGTRVLIADSRASVATSAVDREAVSCPLVLRREGLARGLRALQRDPALRRHGPHHVDPLAE